MLVATPPLAAKHIAALEEIWLLQRELAPSLNEPRVWTGTLRRQALGRSVRFSAGIEGYVATESQMAEVLLGEDAQGAVESTNSALKGYRDAMTFVLQVASQPGFRVDQNFLSAIHFMVMAGDASRSAGKFRDQDVFVADQRSGRVVHEGAPVAQVKTLMEELFSSLARPEPLTLVDAAMAHLNFVLIHPYSDGNGRVARILQSTVLTTEEKPSPLFLSIEEYLGQNTDAYYRVLADVGGGSWNPDSDATAWLEFVLEAHLSQLKQVKTYASLLNLKWMAVARLVDSLSINERVVPAVLHVLEGNRLTNTLYRKLLAESGDQVSALTASRDLALLAERELLSPIGENKSRHYLPAKRLQELKLEIGRTD